MEKFRRRIYSLSALFRDLFSVLKHPRLAVGVLWGHSLLHSFRERLYLTVISVNKCRYCTYLHTRSALRAGLPQDDVNLLLDGTMENVPLKETKALLYAQHWADNDGKPEHEMRVVMLETYGVQKTQAIEMALLLIRIGTLSGNSFDYLLFRVSNGRFGLT